MLHSVHAALQSRVVLFPARNRKAGKVAAHSTNASLRVKFLLAENSDQLDLSECELTELPAQLFELTNLTELSLSGNRLHTLPSQISRLTNLNKLQLAGNNLSRLPEEIGALTQLQGLWAHGNFLEELPTSFGDLASLQKCSLSGNRLHALPSSCSQLYNLIEFEAAGNRLRKLPDLKGLQRLKKLTLHGNQLTEITETVLFCLHLQELALQGNAIARIYAPFCFLPQGLRSLNLADNQLTQFEFDTKNLTSLEHLTLYGNQLETLPHGLLDLPNLKSVWLEGNPLNRKTLEAVTAKKPVKIGLDQNHMASLNGVLSQTSMISISQVPCPYQRGYFKLVSDNPNHRAEMLVVAFGSAPGTPNWGSVLRKAKQTAPEDQSEILQGRNPTDSPSLRFDIVFVVDPRRSWYGAAEDEFRRYNTTLQQICEPYARCFMIGDSMGATAALMFCELASSVLAFCPQVDLQTSSIRPASSVDKWAHFKSQITQSIENSTARIEVVTGVWSHDLDQVKHLDKSKVHHSALQIDTHRLTAYLQHNYKLVPLVRESIKEEFRARETN